MHRKYSTKTAHVTNIVISKTGFSVTKWKLIKYTHIQETVLIFISNFRKRYKSSISNNFCPHKWFAYAICSDFVPSYRHRSEEILSSWLPKIAAFHDVDVVAAPVVVFFSVKSFQWLIYIHIQRLMLSSQPRGNENVLPVTVFQEQLAGFHLVHRELITDENTYLVCHGNFLWIQSWWRNLDHHTVRELCTTTLCGTMSFVKIEGDETLVFEDPLKTTAAGNFTPPLECLGYSETFFLAWRVDHVYLHWNGEGLQAKIKQHIPKCSEYFSHVLNRNFLLRQKQTYIKTKRPHGTHALSTILSLHQIFGWT